MDNFLSSNLWTGKFRIWSPGSPIIVIVTCHQQAWVDVAASYNSAIDKRGSIGRPLNAIDKRGSIGRPVG